MFIQGTPDRTDFHNEDFCSVVITSFSRFNLLHPLIDSIHRYADMPFELIISEDAGHLHTDYDFIKDLRPKVSRIELNLGKHVGMATSFNTGVGAARSKNIIFFNDDAVVIKPFMRKVCTVMKEAPYVGLVWLNCSPPEHAHIHCKTQPSGLDVYLFAHHAGSSGFAFRKDYWLEIGGMAEYGAFGGSTIAGKGWQLGYLCAGIGGGRFCYDVDHEDHKQKYSTGSMYADACHKHYPKIFGISEEVLYTMSRERTNHCSQYEDNKRKNEPFNEFSYNEWRPYFEECARLDHEPDWDKMSQRFSRFLDLIKRDMVPGNNR